MLEHKSSVNLLLFYLVDTTFDLGTTYQGTP